MIPVVLDCGILIAGLGWPGNPRACLTLAAHRQIIPCVTQEVWADYDTRIPQRLAEERPGVDPRPFLDWLVTITRWVDPAQLGKRRSRDVKDDRCLACAFGAEARFLVSNDRNLLDLGKPFGVAVVTPVQLLRYVRGDQDV